MGWNFNQALKLFSNDDKAYLLNGGYFGIERETQRITPKGDLALTPHPAVFGDKEENTRITTDFSESQIEMITPTFESVEEVYESLKEIFTEVEKGINEELLWPLSMPPKLPTEEMIPVAVFKQTKEGREKTAYRNGLAYRYGKKMQMISGIHYNFSFKESMIQTLYERFGGNNNYINFKNEMYMAITRNFLRYRWLLIYLFGASPNFDATFSSVIEQELKIVEKCCPESTALLDNFNQNATSLRVSRFGYSDINGGRINIYYNDLDEYITKLKKMLNTKSKKYSKTGENIGDKSIQLNKNILQKESEFYSSIRLKQNTASGETQLSALEDRGVKYLEVRLLDVNPHEKLGITLQQLHFLQVFMLYCLFERSPKITQYEFERINSNHHMTALFGRMENLLLYGDDHKILPLQEFGKIIFEKLQIIADLMDKAGQEGKYSKSAAAEYAKLEDLSLLPSERIQREMVETNTDFINYGLKLINEIIKN